MRVAAVCVLPCALPSVLPGTPRSYWLIVPAPPQTVEVLPGQCMTIYPTVQPQQLFAAGNHPPLMARVGSGEEQELCRAVAVVCRAMLCCAVSCRVMLLYC